MKKLTKKDKGTIKLALYLAIDYEESYLDALGPSEYDNRKDDGKYFEEWRENSKQNITNFKRLYTLFTE